MIRVGVGHSIHVSGETAAREATMQAMERAGIARAGCAFTFATTHYCCEYTRLLKSIHQVSGAQHISGCSATGVLTSDGEIENSRGFAVMTAAGSDLSCHSFLVPRSGDDVIHGSDIGSEILPHLSSPAMLVLFPDLFSIRPSTFLQEIEMYAPNLPVVGGAASGAASRMESFQWTWQENCESINHCVSHHAVAGMLVSGGIEPFIGVAQGCHPIGAPYTITRAEGNLIYEIAGRPATAILDEVMNTLSDTDIPHVVGSLFAGLVIDEAKYPLERGDYLIRNIAGIQLETGAILITDEVRAGQTIQFNLRDRESAHEDMQRALRDLSTRVAGKNIVAGLYFNCLGRGQGLYGEANHDTSMIKETFPDVPVIGFFSNAEFSPVGGRNLVHSYTGVLVLMAERDTPEPRADAADARSGIHVNNP